MTVLLDRPTDREPAVPTADFYDDFDLDVSTGWDDAWGEPADVEADVPYIVHLNGAVR